MRYIWQHINAIIDTYNGKVPLQHFLKNYYKQHPILGSRDRKLLSSMAYSWYRCSKGLASTSVPSFEEKIKKCLELCGYDLSKIPAINTIQSETIFQYKNNSLFPFDIELSSGISSDAWLNSMLTQPDLFIRIRKDKDQITKLLTGRNIPHTFISDTCLSLPNSTKIEDILPLDSYVVQDASSQQTGNWFHPEKNEQWYDCCSGAGGKSILLKDLKPSVHLTVTDVRERIIYNLTQRFRQYRMALPTAHIADAASPEDLNKAFGTKQFGNIICDAPCSGSGTWARTPEQMFFFDPSTLPDYTERQKAIATNVVNHLKKDGRLIYITCSVFKAENEDVVSEILDNTSLKLEHMQIINGVSIHADSMFIAILRKG